MSDPTRPQERNVDSTEVQITDIEGTPLPDELTGRASKTDDDLTSLFENDSEEHIKDGFKGGSDEETPSE